ESCEFIRQGDVDITIRGFSQLGELGSLSIVYFGDLSVQHSTVKVSCFSGAFGVSTSHDCWILLEVFDHSDHVYSLWAKCEAEFLVQLDARSLFEHGTETITGIAHRQRGLVYHQSAFGQSRRNVSRS